MTVTTSGRNFRIPLESDDEETLRRLLKDVPTETVVRYDWKSEEGRTFIKTLRKIQNKGVPANWIAEALDVSSSAINGAIAYWERTGSTRSRRQGRRLRQPRPLRPSNGDD